MLFLGIDPGATGAISVHFAKNFGQPAKLLEVDDLPAAEGSVTAGGFAYQLGQIFMTYLEGPDFTEGKRPEGLESVHAMVERQWGRPKDAAHIMRKVVTSSARIEGVLAGMGITYETVSPSTWKKAIGLPPTSDPALGKDQARARATELYPTHAGTFIRKKDHNRADAALIGRYLVYKLGQEYGS